MRRPMMFGVLCFFLFALLFLQGCGECDDSAMPTNQPGPPYAVQAYPLSSTAIRITWKTRPYIDSLRLERSLDGQNWQLVRDRFNQSYWDDGIQHYINGRYVQEQLSPGTLYRYRICAYYRNSYGCACETAANTPF